MNYNENYVMGHDDEEHTITLITEINDTYKRVSHNST